MAVPTLNPPARSTAAALFSLPVIVAALGYFVDIYDLLLFGIVRLPSLQSLGLNAEQISTDGTRIRDALSKLDLVNGPQSFMYERVTFDSTGFMPRTTLVAGQVSGGQTKVIWPDAYQSVKPMWPSRR